MKISPKSTGFNVSGDKKRTVSIKQETVLWDSVSLNWSYLSSPSPFKPILPA